MDKARINELKKLAQTGKMVQDVKTKLLKNKLFTEWYDDIDNQDEEWGGVEFYASQVIYYLHEMEREIFREVRTSIDYHNKMMEQQNQ